MNDHDASERQEDAHSNSSVIFAAIVVAVSIIGFACSAILVLGGMDSRSIQFLGPGPVIGTVSMCLLIVGAWALYNVAPVHWSHPLAALGYLLLFLPAAGFFILLGWTMLSTVVQPTDEDSSFSWFLLGLILFLGAHSAFSGWKVWIHVAAVRLRGKK